MFDDLRKGSDDQSSFFQDDLSEIDPLLEKKPQKSGTGLKINLDSRNFMGMNAFQRFIISTLLLIVICIMGTMLLMITGKIVLY